ncbi:hypothetical protein MVEN_01094700 [Mycena venus]|uniref:Uncharacterized protein n=1 Tax=Mycena venus TaxID=2733690 RepID=A0A8H7D0D2_9AGAR|nr:hypothetical protein MVEN_01094700 [Mycena venus]
MSKESNPDPDSPTGYGMSQWGETRKGGLTDFADNADKNPPSQASNQESLMQELGSAEGLIGSAKGSSSGTVAEASAAFDSNSSENDNSGGDGDA